MSDSESGRRLEASRYSLPFTGRVCYTRRPAIAFHRRTPASEVIMWFRQVPSTSVLRVPAMMSTVMYRLRKNSAWATRSLRPETGQGHMAMLHANTSCAPLSTVKGCYTYAVRGCVKLLT